MVAIFEEAGASFVPVEFEDRRVQAAATGLITYIETCFDEEDEQDNDLVHLAMKYSRLYAEGLEEDYPSLVKEFTFYNDYSFNVAAGLGTYYNVVDYNFVEYDQHNAIPLSYYGDLGTAPQPLYFGIHNRWFDFIGPTRYGMREFNLAYEQSPLLYFPAGNRDFDTGQGIQQRSLTAQFAYSVRLFGSIKTGLDFGPSIGGGFSQVRDVQFSEVSNQIANLEFEDYRDGNFFLHMGLNARLTLNRLTFFARYAYNDTLSDAPEDRDDNSAAFTSHTIHTGVSVTLSRRVRFF